MGLVLSVVEEVYCLVGGWSSVVEEVYCLVYGRGSILFGGIWSSVVEEVYFLWCKLNIKEVILIVYSTWQPTAKSNTGLLISAIISHDIF